MTRSDIERVLGRHVPSDIHLQVLVLTLERKPKRLLIDHFSLTEEEVGTIQSEAYSRVPPDILEQVQGAL